jgi:hypothetical protein
MLARKFVVLSLTLAFAGCSGSPSGDGASSTSESEEGESANTSAESADASSADASSTDDSGTDESGDDGGETPDPDVNGDGTINILVLGTNQSIEQGAEAFSPDQIAAELQSVLSADSSIAENINVVAEDIYLAKQITTGLGQGGTEYEYQYHRHSLAQYYYWPEDQEARLANLAGEGGVDWDHVVIAGDPHIVSTAPGYYSLGVNKVAAKVAQGDAQPLLLMMWPGGADSGASVDHFAEHTYRTADGSKVALPAIAAGRAWEALPADKKDSAATHPTPNGAYLAGAAIYAHLFDQSASASDYAYDDDIADSVFSTLGDEAGETHYSGPVGFVSPFKSCDISDRILNYNHTGTSSENGILSGFNWVCAKARVQVNVNGTPPINFNYGRANTNFEPEKRYQIDPAAFDFSLGFPMQDHSNNGNVSMLYGLDKRVSNTDNGTDLGVSRFMVREAELPYARAIPLRTLFAQMHEASPGISAYGDGWHMSGDLDKAAGAYMFTLLTGHCALDAEPEDQDSGEWRTWAAHKTGYETAWNVMHLQGAAPGFRVLPDAPDSISVTPSEGAGLTVSFANPPTGDVTVSLSIDNSAAASVEPTSLVFTPDNYDQPQAVTLMGLDGPLAEEPFVVTASTESTDTVFDDVSDSWEYLVIR